MECYHCRGRLVRRAVSYSVNRKGYHLVLDDVPAWVCEQCSEPVFDEGAVAAIEAMLREVDRGREKLNAAA